MHSKKLFKNTALMTSFSVLMRIIGLSFQVFISNAIGAEGIGLFQLVMSVNSLAIPSPPPEFVSRLQGWSQKSSVSAERWTCVGLYAAAFSTQPFSG